jgi:hypothetical protein
MTAMDTTPVKVVADTTLKPVSVSMEVTEGFIACHLGARHFEYAAAVLAVSPAKAGAPCSRPLVEHPNNIDNAKLTMIFRMAEGLLDRRDSIKMPASSLPSRQVKE